MGMDDCSYRGIIFIGDPHLASRTPGFRKDLYPKVILEKLQWCFSFAKKNKLLPVLLGDLFHWPRENANWLLGEIFALLNIMGEVLAIPGNHDCHEDHLGEHDSLMVLARAKSLTLIDREGPRCVKIGGRDVWIGGSAWGEKLPKCWGPPNKSAANAANTANEEESKAAWVLWVTHHDVGFPGYEFNEQVHPHEILGIDIIVNGHLHQSSAPLEKGQTTWFNPGNIARLERSEASQKRAPSVMCWFPAEASEGAADIGKNIFSVEGWWVSQVEVPHRPFDEVFYPLKKDPHRSKSQRSTSPFVQGLAELLERKTDEGAGLKFFLEQNTLSLDHTSSDNASSNAVSEEIRALAEEVIQDKLKK